MFNLMLGIMLLLNGVVVYLLVKVNANQDRLLLQLEQRLARLEGRRRPDEQSEGIDLSTTERE